jgi:hypothetical protein
MPTFRQRASQYNQRVTPPEPPKMSPDEHMEQVLQGGWIIPEGEHYQYRFFSGAEIAARPSSHVVRESDLSSDQLEVYGQLVRWYANDTSSRQVIRIGGLAGTGKSTIVSVFAREHHADNIAFCSFTGKAANVLKTKLREADVRNPGFVGTIHRMMYTTKTEPDGTARWERREFLDYDLIVVDEASMVNEGVFDDMLSYGIPIMAVGDHGQLAPIEGSFNLMNDPDLKLEKIHRQAEGSPIIALASYIRQEGELPERYPNNELVSFVHPSQMRRGLEELYHQDLDPQALSDIAILSYTNGKRRMANNLVRELRWGVKEDEPPRDNDLFICLRNRGSYLFNGMRSRAVKVHPHGELWLWSHAVFDADDMEIKGLLFKQQFNRNTTYAYHHEVKEFGFGERGWMKDVGLLFDYGYCLTVHKSQGSSFKNVFMLYERPNMVDRDEFRRWLYTAVTRSSEKLSIVIR